MSEPAASSVANPYAAPLPVAEPSPLAAALPHDGEIRALFERGKAGAAWFYWIAGLSLLNTVMVMVEAKRTFAVGLGVTVVADAIGMQAAQNPGPARTTILAVITGFN